MPQTPPNTPPTTSRKTRVERVALHASPKGPINRFRAEMRRDHQGLLFLLLVCAVMMMGVIIRAWDPPFKFRLHDLSSRVIVCNTPFSISSPKEKQLAEDRARWLSPHVYVNDPEPLIQLRVSLWNTLAALVNVNDYDQLDAASKKSWLQFLTPVGKTASENAPADPKAAFDTFVSFFKNDTNLDLFNNRLKKAFTPFEVYGMLTALHFGPEDRGSQDQILVYRKGESPDRAVLFKVSDVLIRDGARLYESLFRELQNETLARQLLNWLQPKLVETLKKDDAATAAVAQKAVAAVRDVILEYVPGQILVEAGVAIGPDEMNLLEAEYAASLKFRKNHDRVLRFLAISTVISILYLICWGIVRKRERRRPKSIRAFSGMLVGMLLTIAMARLLYSNSMKNADWEIFPLLMFAQTITITFSWELAVVFSSLMILVISIGTGTGTGHLIILLGGVLAATLQLGRLRSRKKLLLVSMLSGLIACLLTFSVGILAGRPADWILFQDSSINLFWTLLAGLVMTGLLPFIEEPFGILTDMSLLELGDVSHPLLQSLIRLAPATYGHSMQVGTIAETAADAIGARGLLTRVGAYFHDIGKIMHPEYYSENQGGHGNIHDHLEPQVSTIVLISHVKDGIDLARQHRLPKPLTDLIEQHHGTSLVSFFYGRAANKADGKEDAQKVEESTYRYPGPKPQSKEAAILMIADTCESACRSMGAAATPGRIENKVRLLIKQKLDDGQFEECGMTLRELSIVENSVIKSIIASMHGRIRYPGQDDDVVPQTSQSQPVLKVVAEPVPYAEKKPD